MNRDVLVWMRDWALIGALTSGVAPIAASLVLPLEGLAEYGLVAAAIGLATGAPVGLLLRVALGCAPERTRVALALVCAPVPLGGWGAYVAWQSAALVAPQFEPLALLCGSIAAMVQVAWIAPAYTWVARHGWPRLPVALSSALTAPFGGLVAVAAVLLAFLP